MAAIIKNRQVVADTWQLLKPAADKSLPPVPPVTPTGDVIVPLTFWLDQRDVLLSRAGRLGVWLDSHEDPAAIAGDLDRFALVAVNFPQFGDGRGYSIARLLRERHGYKGELRAIGDIQRDQLLYLARCGFDAFDLRESEDIEVALAAFDDFTEAYQASVDRPVPLFRRREIAGWDS